MRLSCLRCGRCQLGAEQEPYRATFAADSPGVAATDLRLRHMIVAIRPSVAIRPGRPVVLEAGRCPAPALAASTGLVQLLLNAFLPTSEVIMFSSRLSTSSLCSAVTISLFVGACGGAKPVEANAPRSETGAVAATATQSQRSTARPEPIPVHVADEIRQACGVADQDAYFAFDSAQLDSPDVRTLNKVATCFTVGPLKGRRVKVVGHADPRGTEDYNMSLGLSRADSVAGYLRTKGLDRAKEWTSTRGAMDATGRDEPGWQKDRRVDLMLGE